MIVTYVRSSSYNNYSYCEMQYFITYVLGHQSDSGKKADMGTMAHKVMEILAGLKKFQQDNSRKKYLVVDDDAAGKIRIHKDRLYTDEFVDELCEIAIDCYAKNSKHKFGPKDRRDIAETVYTFLTHSDGQFDPRLRNIHHPELLLYFYAISKLYPDFPNRIMSIFFYKDIDGNPDPKPFSLCFGKEDEVRFLEMLKNRVEEIRQNNSPKLLDRTRKHWKCKYLCHFAKNNWPGTDKKMCIHIEESLKEQGMEKTMEDCTREGFNIGFYEAPG